MSIGSKDLRKDLEHFQKAVRDLSSKIQKASMLWNDKQFNDLNNSVKDIARQSKNVMTTAEKGCDSIDRFERIASERY